jgi:hypothetical protein
LLVVALTLSTSVLAQVPASTFTYPGENGVKMGAGRLHPYFDFEMRYDSAAGFFGAPGGTTQLKPEIVAHFRPGLKLDIPSPTLALGLNGNVDYVWYTGLLTSGSNSISRLQADADASAAFNQGGTLELDLGDHFSRSDRTHNPAVGVGVLSVFNEASAAVPIRPGGKALELVPKAAFAFENFSAITPGAPPGCTAGDPTCDPAGVSGMNYQNLRLGMDVRWKFLPKTAVMLEGRYDARSYNAGSSSPKSSLFKAEAGLAGLVSPKVATVVKAGWGKDFSGTGANTIIGQVEFTYLMSETSRLKVGYLRNLEPVPTLGSYTDDRPYGEIRLLLNGRTTLHANASFDNLAFHSNPSRTDKTFTLDVGPEHQFLPWLVGAAGYVLSTRSSNAPATSVNFTRHEAYVRATFIY